MSQKHGASALGLQRVLGLGSYQTAWTWLHKLRRAMVRPARELLHGSIEVDEAYIGGAGKGRKRGRSTENKEILVIAVEVFFPKGFGRIRMRRVPHVSGDSLIPFVNDVVKSGSEILTDGWRGYNGLLEYYLDEYTFRFNRRTSRSRGMLFYRLMQQAAVTTSAP